MASPTRLGTATTAFATSTSYPLTLPTVAADQLLLAFVGVNSGGSDSMSGWRKVGNASNGTQMVGVYAKKAVGSGDSGTVTGGNLNRFAIVTAVEGWDGDVDTVAVATATGKDSPSLNAGASRDHLWVAFARTDNVSITTAPTNYTDFAQVSLTTVVRLAIASRELTAQTENPGAFNGTANAAVCGTVAVRPGTAGLPVNTSTFLPFF